MFRRSSTETADDAEAAAKDRALQDIRIMQPSCSSENSVIVGRTPSPKR
jgi:hypothetical protein